MLLDPVRVSAFVDDAHSWHRTGAESSLLRLIRSSCSGVAHDVAAAYATLSPRTEPLLDAIDRGRLALGTDERESVIRFAIRARRVRALPQELDEASRRESILQIFEIETRAEIQTAGYGEVPPSAEFELTEPASPEPELPVAPWEKHFSASALNAYAQCPRRWFYKYACAAVEDRGSAASAYGSAFHLALEDFHGEFPRPQDADAQAMRRRIRECVTWAFERNRAGFATAVEFELQVRRAQRTAQRYVDWTIAAAKEAPFEVVGREVAAELDLDGRPFVGYIDRLDRDERSGGTRVVDYKTGSIATNPQEYAAEVRAYRDFQLPFYYWARTAGGDRVTHLVLIPLRDALLDVRPVVMHVGRSITVDDLQRSRAKMIELGDELAAGRISRFQTTADPSACTFCAYAIACSKKPAAAAPRFGS